MPQFSEAVPLSSTVVQAKWFELAVRFSPRVRSLIVTPPFFRSKAEEFNVAVRFEPSVVSKPDFLEPI